MAVKISVSLEVCKRKGEFFLPFLLMIEKIRPYPIPSRLVGVDEIIIQVFMPRLPEFFHQPAGGFYAHRHESRGIGVGRHAIVGDDGSAQHVARSRISR